MCGESANIIVPLLCVNRVVCTPWFQMSELDKVSAPMMPHPHDFIKKSNVNRCNPWMPEYEVQNK